MQHVAFLASDAMKGRGNGTPELQRAAEYIASEFASYGLEPLGDRRSFFQHFPATVEADIGSSNSLRVDGVELQLDEDFVPLPLSSSGVYDGGLVFAGYGITAPELRWDDYAGIDVAGKAVVILSSYPGGALPLSQPHVAMTSVEMKARTAKRHGAKAILFVIDWNKRVHRDSLTPIDPEFLVPHDLGLLAAYVSRDAVEPMFAGMGRSIADVQQEIERSRRPNSFALTGASVRLATDIRRAATPARNVVAALPGRDPRAKHEWLILGAHYDHLGLGFDDVWPSVEAGTLHHGADDNASGTAGLLELARTLAESRDSLKRSVLFVAFAGEELGLMGSNHFVDTSPVPLHAVSAMLNLDMIGRMSRSTVHVMGARVPEVLADWIRGENTTSQLNLTFSSGDGGGSDWAVFQAMGIPALTFFTGIHEDYHLPSDTIDKINSAGAGRILTLVEGTARRIADAHSNLRRLPVRLAAPRGKEPHLGAEPIFDPRQHALRFDSVPAGSPLARAGVQRDDVLADFADLPARSVLDFQSTLQVFRPGDVASLTVRRRSRLLRLTATVGTLGIP